MTSKKKKKYLNTDEFSDLSSTSHHPSSHIFCLENGLHFSPFTQWSIQSNSLNQRGTFSAQSSGSSSESLLYLSKLSKDMRHKPWLFMLHQSAHVNMIPLLTLTLSTLYFTPWYRPAVFLKFKAAKLQYLWNHNVRLGTYCSGEQRKKKHSQYLKALHLNPNRWFHNLKPRTRRRMTGTV